MARVIVIGAGMGGLAAAARLRIRRHGVTVLEQSAIPGGKVGTFERDGFVFDTGPSLLTLPAVYRDLFLSTGASLDDTLDVQPLEPAFGYRWADGTTAAMPGAGPARPADIRAVAPFTSLRSLGRQLLHDPRLVTLLDRYATYTGSDPRRAPAALATVPYVEQVFGAWHLGGGIRTLADALYQRACERGVDFEFGADVTRILTESGAVSGVELADGRRMTADVVVANADASHVYGDLLDSSLPSLREPRRRLARAVPSLSGFVLLLAVRGRTPGVQHHNVWFTDDYDAEFDGVFGTGRSRIVRAVTDPTIYACVPDDPLMRPDDDHESWFVLVNAPRHGNGEPGTATMNWNAPGVADAYADRILEVLAGRGVDVRDRVLWREVRTPADLERATRAPGGAIYGSSSNGARSAFLRPSNRSPVPGLFLVGGSAHPGGGLPLVGMSASIVADLVGRAT